MNDSEQQERQNRWNNHGRVLRLTGAFCMALGILVGVRGAVQVHEYEDRPPTEDASSSSFNGTNAEAVDAGKGMESVGIGLAIGGAIATAAGIVVVRRNPEDPQPNLRAVN